MWVGVIVGYILKIFFSFFWWGEGIVPGKGVEADLHFFEVQKTWKKLWEINLKFCIA